MTNRLTYRVGEQCSKTPKSSDHCSISVYDIYVYLRMHIKPERRGHSGLLLSHKNLATIFWLKERNEWKN